MSIPGDLALPRILDQPAEHFFQMLDVFTAEEYLLYSPGMSTTLTEDPIHLWFNLIAFNGKCWETFGLIIGFNSFTPYDLFFFATELNPDIEDDQGMMREVEKNPWPFFMILYGSRHPFTQSQGELLVYHSAFDDVPSFPYDQLKESFEIRQNDGVYELQLENWSESPHFAKAYYDETEKALFRFSFTKAGFAQLNKILGQQGVVLDLEPHVKSNAQYVSYCRKCTSPGNRCQSL